MENSRILSTILLAPAALLLAIVAPGCASPKPPPQACTEIGCSDGLTVALSPSSGWRAGMYRFEIDVDGQVTTCEGSLPLRACSAGPSLRCTPAGDRVSIGESGCALPPEQHGFSELRVGAPPARSVKVTVTRDGAKLVEQTLAPQYRTVQPNGPSCPPICRQASETLVIPADVKK